MSDKPKVLKRPANFVTQEGNAFGFAVCLPGDPVPDNLAPGQLEHKTALDVFDEPEDQDWEALGQVGIAKAPGSESAMGLVPPAPVMPSAPVPAGIVPPSAQ